MIDVNVKEYNIKLNIDGEYADMIFEEIAEKGDMKDEEWNELIEQTEKAIEKLEPVMNAKGRDIKFRLKKEKDRVRLKMQMNDKIDTVSTAIIYELLPMSIFRNMSVAELLNLPVLIGVKNE